MRIQSCVGKNAAFVLIQAWGSVFTFENASLCIFTRISGIEYSMRKIIRFICACLCLCALAGGAVAAFCVNEGRAEEQSLKVLTLWQIDSFEGGIGSRADYLRNVAEEFSQSANTYIEVTSLSAAAARQNIANGTTPDIISYGAGFYGIENIVPGTQEAWCNGAYCLISLSNSDFSSATPQNTVVNSGRDNLSEAAALLCGLGGADFAAPTSAYVQLINGEYEYMLGTQRDIRRLKVRGETFYIEPVEEFNDLYQYIAVLTPNGEKATLGHQFINYLLTKSDGLTAIGMLKSGVSLYDDEMSELENTAYGYTVAPVVSEGAVGQIKSAIRSGDINLLKSLLKPL